MPGSHPFLAATTAAALLLVAAACERDAVATPDAPVLRDSAGIEIVENHDLGWAAGEGWRVDDTPALDIGVIEGDPMYQLFAVAGATRLPDGRVAVALAGSSEIRIYGPDGIFLQSVGRDGEGPGEFRQLLGLWAIPGDSLLAWDEGLRRATVLDADGGVGRQISFDANASNPTLLRPMPDGRMALIDQRSTFPDAEMADQFMEVTLHTPTGELEDSVGRFVFARMGPVAAEGLSRVGAAIFAPRTDIATAAQTLVVGNGSATEFSVYEPEGALARIVRWPDSDRAVVQADVDRYREQQIARVEDENRRRAERTLLALIPYERQFPVYDRIVPTSDGGVWLRSYRRPGAEGPAIWIVVDSAGRRLGEVSAPRGLWVFEVGQDYLLGLERDELDVEHVRLYRLVKE